MTVARAGSPSRSRTHLWVVRVVALLALAVTVWLFGPRAAAVLAARLRVADTDSPAVALDRVGFARLPDWVSGPALLAVAADLHPWLQGDLPILDDVTGAQLQAGLRSVPWVREARLERVYPDRFRLELDLRRPVAVVTGPDDAAICLVDGHGVALPHLPMQLPALPLRREGGSVPRAWQPGEPFPDPRVQAGVAVLAEWAGEVRPLVPGAPDLLAVDANNLGERWAQGPRHPEIRVVLRRSDGAPVVFAYDRAPSAERPRVPHATKASVLRAILAEHPGLTGLTGGDLRLQVRWRDWLLPRTGPDPAGMDLPVGPGARTGR